MLNVGDKAPHFIAQLDDGKTFDLDDFKGRNLILYFYPRDRTPGCTKEACNIRDNYSELIDAGLVIFGVSTDSLTSHLKFKDKHNLPFSLISDKDKEIIKLFGVKSKIGTAKRITFWIGDDGLIKYIWDKVKVITHTQDILEVFEAM